VSVLVLLLAVVVALLAVLVAGLLRSHAEILRALHELGAGLDPDQDPRDTRPGLAVPRDRPVRTGTDLVGVTPSGDAISVGVLGVDHPTLVAFLTSGCSTCSGFWSAFADTRRLHVPGDARLVVATKGEEAESPARLAKFAPPEVPVVMSSDAWTDFDVPVAPYFAFVDGPTGAVIGEGAASTWEHLRTMMEQALADAGFASGRHRRRRSAQTREDRVDSELLSAGLEPGDPSLYPRGDAADLHADPEGGRAQ
jgi:hypothetical protein